MKKTATLTLLLFAFLTTNAQHKKTDTLRATLNKANTDTARYLVLHDLSKLYNYSHPDSSIIIEQQALLLAKKNNWESNQGRSLNTIASAYANLGDHVNSTRYYLKALRIFEYLKDAISISAVNNNIGIVYNARNDNKKALYYYFVAEKILDEYTRNNPLPANRRDLKPNTLGNIANTYQLLGKLDSAKYYYEAAQQNAVGVEAYNNGNIMGGLGELEALKGNSTAALRYYRQSATAHKAADDNDGLSAAYLDIAKLYHKNKLPDSAIYYAQKALTVADKLPRDVLDAAKLLYDFYDEAHNLPMAFKYFKLSTVVKDSLYSQDKEKQFLTLNFDEKERQQELLAAQKEAQKEAQNKLRIYLLSGGLGILLLLALIFLRNSRQRKKANELLYKQKEDIEKALAQVKLTQNQLIQSEKMASLGELTAGIAHEIQNPLNFVNNFSEVNREMLDELDEELDKGDIAEAKVIAAGIRQNEQKINHHGKRADFIVKGMLEHSRTGTGERQLTNINVLAEEFFKLSYQGLRAKDKTFNSELTTHFAADLPQINVVQQDMGRVLVNLFNNAFYAVNQKKKIAGDDYKPEVTLTTARENGSLLIKVKDNGVGIPDTIKEKILQPFFTTKPTGEGTGLGLSLSYDILVKGHSGAMDIISSEGKGAEFIIRLPLN